MSDRYHDLKVIMFAKKINQKELAKMLGITAQSLNAKLNGRSDFTIQEAEKIIRYLDIKDPSKIFFKSSLRDTKVC